MNNDNEELTSKLTDYNYTDISVVKTPTDASTTIAAHNPPSHLIITADNTKEMVRIDFDTGNVIFGEDYNVDEASRIFWESMGQDSPDMLKKEIQRLDKQVTHLTEMLAEQGRLTTKPISVGVDFSEEFKHFQEQMAVPNESTKSQPIKLDWKARCNRKKPEKAFEKAMEILD